MGGHVLKVKVQGGDHVHAFNRVDQVVVRDGHPLVAGHLSGQLLALLAGEFVVPGAFNAHAFACPVDADCPRGQDAEGSAPALATFEDQAAFVASHLHEGQGFEGFVIRERNVPADEGAAVALASGVVELVQNGAGRLSRGLGKHRAEGVDALVVHVPAHAFASGVPAQVVHRHACGQEASVVGQNLAPCRLNGPHCVRKFLRPCSPTVVFPVLDDQDAPENSPCPPVSWRQTRAKRGLTKEVVGSFGGGNEGWRFRGLLQAEGGSGLLKLALLQLGFKLRAKRFFFRHGLLELVLDMLFLPKDALGLVP